VKVRVHYQDSSNKNRDEIIELPKLSTANSLIDLLNTKYARVVVLNGRMVPPDFVLEEDSEVFVFMQMAGG
jgi:sulfur carrier protein ThiS